MNKYMRIHSYAKLLWDKIKVIQCVFFLLSVSATAQNFNPLPDTIVHCSNENHIIIVSSNIPIVWENGDTNHNRSLSSSGIYWVRNLISQEKDSVFFLNYSRQHNQTLDTNCNKTINLITNCGISTLSDGLVSFFDFNDSVRDYVAANQVIPHNITNGTGHNGRPNGSAHFNGTSSYIQTNASGNRLPLTLASYIKPTNLNGERSVIDCGVPGQFGHSLIIGYWANGFPLSNLGDQTIDVQYHDGYYNSSNTILTNQWTHVATTIDSSEIKLYINGALVASVSYQFQGSLDGTNFRIGRHDITDPQWYHGEMDNTGIWSRKLCDEEIRLLSQGFRPQNISVTLNGVATSLTVPNDSLVLKTVNLDGMTLCVDTISRLQYNRLPLGALNTGKNSFPSGGASVLDSNWQVSMTKLGTYNPATLVTIPTGVWYSSPWQSTEWISINLTGTQNVANDTVYFFKTEFNLPCSNECDINIRDSGSFCLDLEMFADNVVRSVYLNGKNVDNKVGLPIPNQYSHVGYISTGKQELYICEGWRPGPNELILEVWTSPYAVGLLVQANENYLNPNYTRDTISLIGCDSLVYEGVTFSNDTLFFDELNSTECHRSYVNLKVNNSSTETMQLQGCQFLIVNTDTIFASRVDTLKMTNKYGCDSTIIMDIIINPVDTIHAYLSNCDSLLFNTMVISKDTLIFENYNNIFGCDSIIASHVTISKSKNVTIQNFSCDSVQIGTSVFRNDTSFISTYVSSSGCDSNVTNQIVVGASQVVRDTINVCYSFNLNGYTFTSDTVLSSQNVNIDGCDSLYVLNLEINQPDSIQTTISFCDSLSFNGMVFYSDTVVHINLVNSSNCDSILSYNLIKNISKHETKTLLSCDSLYYNGMSFKDDTTFVLGFYTSSGCDSTVQFIIDINSTSVDTLYYSTCDSISFSGSNYWIGVHILSYNGATNCDSTIILIINQDTAMLKTDRIVKFCETEVPFYLKSHPGYHFENGRDSILVSRDLIQGNFIYELKQDGICFDTIKTYLFLSDTCDYSIFIPNTFTPNKDVVNDRFRVSSLGIVQIQFMIFDRWGNLVYLTSDLDFEWGGTYSDGTHAPEGIYTFKAIFVSHSRKEIFKYGTITLIR